MSDPPALSASSTSPLAQESDGKTYSTGQLWPAIQEGMLQAIVARAQLPKRTTHEHWMVVADHPSRAGQHLGLPLRSPSSCWRKAARMGLIAHREEKRGVEQVHVPAQSSFATPEVKAEVSRALVAALRKLADEMERAHG